MNSSLLYRVCVTSTVALAMLVSTDAQQMGRKPAAFTATDLGTLGGAYSFAYSINAAGVIAGGAATPSQTDGFAQTAFIWNRGQLISLGTLGGSACPGCSSQGAAVSANGTAAVLSETAVSNGPDGEDFCEFGTHHECLAAVWRDGVLTALPTLPGGHNSEAYFTNARGEIVGVSETGVADACAMPFQQYQFEAVKWSLDGTPVPLPPLPNDTVSFAFMTNNKGQAVGMSGLCSNVILPPFVAPSAPHAVLWDESGTPHDLGTPAGSTGQFNVANSMNNQGQVVMDSMMQDGTLQAFLWSATTDTLQNLGTYPDGAILTVVPCCNTINDRGQIVGFSLDADGNLHGLFWPKQDANPLDLNNLLPDGSPWYVLSPAGINNAGEIAATALNLETSELHAVLLSPVTGIGPAARKGITPSNLPENLRRIVRRQIHF